MPTPPARRTLARRRRGCGHGCAARPRAAPEHRRAPDAVIETPFAPPGRPRRFTGREEFLAFATAGRAALPVRFEECGELAVHETADPQVIVVEYELSGTVTSTGRRAAAPFIGVLRVRDGQIAGWREYQDAIAIAHALGQLPALLASTGTAADE